jgi:hypothetical protein
MPVYACGNAYAVRPCSRLCVLPLTPSRSPLSVYDLQVSTMSANSTETGPTKSVGPDYRAESQKPFATVSNPVKYENVITLPQTPQLIALLT